MQDNILQAVNAGFQGVQDQFQGVQGQIDEVKVQVGQVDGRVNQLDKKIDDVQRVQRTHSVMIDETAKKVDILYTEAGSQTSANIRTSKRLDRLEKHNELEPLTA